MGVGETLAAAREERGLTVEDVSRATRIRGELLRRIEQDDFSGCGGAVYARGHVRAIATHLGLDPAELVAEFDRTHGKPEAPAASEIFEHEVVAVPQRTGPNWTAAMAVAAGVLLIVALVSLFNTAPTGAPSARQVTSTSPTPTVAPSSPAAQPTSGPLAGQVPGDGVSMRVDVVTDRSWVTVRGDGNRVLFQGLLKQGDQRDFTAKRVLSVVLGNAGAVELVVNGEDLGKPGRLGQVVRLTFEPDSGSAG